MNDRSLKTLFHPFEAGMLEGPGAEAKVLFINAAPGFALPEAFPASLTLQQDFRPAFRALEGGTHALAPQAEGEGYDLTMVLAGRHRGQNELWVGEALRRTRPAGRIMVAGGKTDGIASLRKRIAGLLPVDDHASKNHGVVFWLTRPDDAGAFVEALEAANPPQILDGGFVTVPGIFSQDHADEGSKLLAEHLPAQLNGHAADFGAGWGYLSVKLAERAPDIGSIDLFEASFPACVAAKANMNTLVRDVESRVQWHDLLSEPVERRYDVVVMNPPFHQGRAAEPSIGDGFIRAASAALKPGGKLYLVANRSLPYEGTLEAAFARHGEVVRDERFKVLWAVR